MKNREVVKILSCLVCILVAFLFGANLSYALDREEVEQELRRAIEEEQDPEVRKAMIEEYRSALQEGLVDNNSESSEEDLDAGETQEGESEEKSTEDELKRIEYKSMYDSLIQQGLSKDEALKKMTDKYGSDPREILNALDPSVDPR